MDSSAHVSLWDDFHQTGLGTMPLAKALSGLTPAQAARHPQLAGGEGHSIWQIVHHLIHARTAALEQATAGRAPAGGQPACEDFAEPTSITQEAWDSTLARLAKTQGSVRTALSDGRMAHEHFRSLIPHDSYHLGEIMQLRGFFGVTPLA